MMLYTLLYIYRDYSMSTVFDFTLKKRNIEVDIWFFQIKCDKTYSPIFEIIFDTNNIAIKSKENRACAHSLPFVFEYSKRN